MDWIKNHIWLLLFVLWGLPLGVYRSKFRKMVYQTQSWIINIKPVFGKELKALFGNLYPNNGEYKRFRNFYRLYLGIYAVLFIAYLIFDTNSTNMKAIKIGDRIPIFELKDQNGVLFKIDSVIGKKNLVVYFYPKDDTPGCTKEACSFRDQFQDFEDADALIIGISGQSVESHRNFADKYKLNYTLLSDKRNRVRKLFGVPSNLFGLIPGRVSYVIDKNGKVAFVFNSQFQAEKHVQEALQILKNLK